MKYLTISVPVPEDADWETLFEATNRFQEQIDKLRDQIMELKPAQPDPRCIVKNHPQPTVCYG